MNNHKDADMYNTETASLHHGSGKIETVTIQDATPGKHGFTGIIHENGVHEFVDSYELSYGNHDAENCELCMFKD